MYGSQSSQALLSYKYIIDKHMAVNPAKPYCQTLDMAWNMTCEDESPLVITNNRMFRFPLEIIQLLMRKTIKDDDSSVGIAITRQTKRRKEYDYL